MVQAICSFVCTSRVPRKSPNLSFLIFVLNCPWHSSAKRKCFMKNSQRDFWDSVDANLRSLREKLGGDETKISDYFHDTLKEDRRIHGVENMAESASLPRTANVWQREIDEIVNNAD
ncbi:uncharacterized protein PHACADRAFT_198922 [Phanerochaete carnosa HHB-10118-sp]|uniref:Uncharacterized protein n=1 Tax=Phanerochaete carnosa (strain HHB-10118-sp) TaxID=650164 RepID=K5VN61_PHACS|nr:uncharacterized protein PHACADRAFT_198922 [Phanerochaete carnosa HHB-10118-sp]EKM52873.1 hypothetical protein PHACADRAFT_198922 [Phanerochaete carnosa HHB-10118-sp]